MTEDLAKVASTEFSTAVEPGQTRYVRGKSSRFLIFFFSFLFVSSLSCRRWAPRTKRGDDSQRRDEAEVKFVPEYVYFKDILHGRNE